MNLELEPSTEAPPLGLVIENTILDPTRENITMGSNGSVHLVEEIAAAAWLVTHDEESKVSAVFLLENISSNTSYRAELEGIFRGLGHIDYLGLTPKEVAY